MSVATILHLSPFCWISTAVLVVWGVWDLWGWKKHRDRVHLRDGVFLILLGLVDLAGGYHEQREVDSANADVATEHDARVVIENKLSGLKDKIVPRRLSPSERDKLIASITSIGGLPHFNLQTSISDSEAQQYSEDLAETFQQAGCDVSGGGVNTGVDPRFKGLAIAVPDVKNVPEGAKRLAQVLVSAGLVQAPVQLGAMPMSGGAAYELIVGAKPE